MKKNSLIIVIVIAIILIVCILLGVFGIINNSNSNNYIGTYQFHDEKENLTITLYLRKDGTFRQSVYSESGNDLVGTYSINKKNIELSVKVLYSTNGCFFKEGADTNQQFFKTTQATISNKNTIVLPYLESEYKLVKTEDEKETEESLATFTITPQESQDYMDCTTREIF